MYLSSMTLTDQHVFFIQAKYLDSIFKGKHLNIMHICYLDIAVYPIHIVIKPGARQAGARLVSYNHFHSAKVCVCVCVCVYAPEAINN